MRPRLRSTRRAHPSRSSPPTRGQVLRRRAWLVALLTILAGATAWALVQDDPKRYERTLAFVMLPGEEVSDELVPDAVRGLSQQDAQLVNTVGEVLATRRFLDEAIVGAEGVEAPDTYQHTAVIRPGSDVIEVTVSGGDPEVLEEISQTFTVVAVSWVSSTYRAYNLEFLGSAPSDGPVAPNVVQTVTLAALLAGLLALGAVLVEARSRARPASAVSEDGNRTGSVPLLSVDDVTGRIEQVESLLRSQLRQGETLVRVGPRRVAIVADPRADERGRAR